MNNEAVYALVELVYEGSLSPHTLKLLVEHGDMTHEQWDEAIAKHDEYLEWMEQEKQAWESSQPSKSEEMAWWIESGVTEAMQWSMRERYLKEKFAELIRTKYEEKIEVPEIRKIRGEYLYRQKGELSHVEIEQARKYPMERLIEAKHKMALCPFHKEKSPSFSIDKNLYFCFGCGKGGDSIGYVMEKMSLKFGDAIKYLLSL